MGYRIPWALGHAELLVLKCQSDGITYLFAIRPAKQACSKGKKIKLENSKPVESAIRSFKNMVFRSVL